MLETLGGKSVLITGATGLIGSHLVSALREHGGVKIFTASCGQPRFTGTRHFIGDLTEPRNIERLPDADFIIHAAGYGQPSRFLANPHAELRSIQINTSTTAALLKKAHEGFLFLSSSEIYNGTGDPEHPRACYIEGKRCGETICHSYQRANPGLRVRIARVSLAYGPGVRWGDKRVINSLICQGLEHGMIALLDRGEAIRTYCYISDAVEMLLSILFEGRDAVYDVGGKSRVTIRQLGQLIAGKLGVPFFVPKDDEEGLRGAPKEVGVDISRYINEFGKTSFTDLSYGISQTIEWHREMLRHSDEPVRQEA
jgi:nucleoside-diphosphate-sugar epimerase